MTRHMSPDAVAEPAPKDDRLDATRSLRETVIAAVADAEGVDALDLEERLQESVDTDAIEALVDHSGADWLLSFEFAGHDVTVDADATVIVDGRVF